MKKKILILSPIIPYPLDQGGSISQYAFLEKMQFDYDVHLLLVVKKTNELHDIDVLRSKLQGVRIDFINNIQPKSSFITKTKIFIYNIFYSKKAINNNPFHKSMDFFYEYNEKFLSAINSKICEIKPDLLQVEHNAFLNLVNILPMNIPKIFIEHEIKFSLLNSFKNENENIFEKYKINQVKTLEIGLLKQYDKVLTFTPKDASELNNEGLKNVFVSPFPIMDSSFNYNSKCTIKSITFLGGEVNGPNVDGLHWILKSNLPQYFFEKYGLKFEIVGKWSDDFINTYKSEFVIFHGFVDDLNSVISNSINIVPIRQGSGIRTKILYTLAMSVPVVSTDVGAMGIGLEENKHILFANTIDEFIEKIEKLVNDQQFLKDLILNSYDFVYENYNQTALYNKRNEIYKSILNASNSNNSI